MIFRPLHDRVIIRRAEGDLTALQDAGSIAALPITAEAMIADLPARDSPQPAGNSGIGY